MFLSCNFNLYILLSLCAITWIITIIKTKVTKSEKYLITKFEFLVHSFMFIERFVTLLIIGLLVTTRFKLQLQSTPIFLLTKPIIIFLYFDEVLFFKQLCTKYYMPHVWHFLLGWNISSVALNKVYTRTHTLYIISLIKLEFNASPSV